MKPTHQTVRRLSYFAAIAEAGSIRGASAALGLSVPVLSAALSELEEELGTTLAVRTTRRFDLTPTGQAVHAAARDVLRAAQRAVEAANPDPDQQLQGTLSLTTTTELAAHWLPPVLARFRARHPAVHLSVDAQDTALSLRGGAHDLAIRAKGPVHRAQEGLGVLPLACVAGAAVPVGKKADQILVDAPLLLASPGAPVLTAWDRSGGHTIPVHFAEGLVVNNREAARMMAMAGVGVALVLDLACHADLERGALVPVLPEHDFGSVSYDILLRDSLPSPAARAFAQMVRDGV